MKKKTIIGLAIALIACMAFFVACSGENVTKYTVTYVTNGGSSISATSLAEGSSITAPAEPTKDGYILVGWFFDEALEQAVSFPFTLEDDITLYAKWMSNKEYFLAARDATVNSNQFEYNFNLNVTTKFAAFNGPSAISQGNVKYNSASQNSYIKRENNSGLLISDGTIYTVKTGTSLSEFKVNKDNKLYGYSSTQVSNDFKYESSSYAKVLFEYGEDKITAVTKTSQNKYKVTFSGSITGFMNTALNALNSPIVQRFINVPENDSNLNVYVTFDNGKIDKFEYEFSISVSLASITFHYDLDFVKVGTGVTITPPAFQNVSISETDINTDLNDIKSAFTSYKAQQNSGYNYTVKTKVDYPGAFAINSTTAGRTMRNISGNEVYFWNRIEFDSDYKNNDLYKNKGIDDYERYRIKVASGDVYDVEYRVFPPKYEYTKLDDYENGDIDEYYLLLKNEFFNTTNISIVQKASSAGNTTYSLGLTNDGIVALLSFIDENIRVDVNEQNEITIYNIESEMIIKNAEFDIIISEGKITEININIKGSYIGSYPETKFEGACTFELEYELVTNNKGANYTAPDKIKDADLSNS
ncbi:MAG: InlB B-repeat-containing protein [Clostridiaceae bacterium]|nr:InlB B-repeat-containing protein [Clostridiaceae bacterium]